MSVTSVKETLLRAADEIENRGWGRSECFAKDGRVCLMGALYAAHYGNEAADDCDVYSAAEDDPAFGETVDALAEHLGRDLAADDRHSGMPGFEHVWLWNDRRGADQAHVAGKVREAAATLADAVTA